MDKSSQPFYGLANELLNKPVIIDLSHNSPITNANIAECGQLMMEIDNSSDKLSIKSEGDWRTVKDQPVYDIIEDVVPTSEWLSRLRIHSRIFSGYDISQIVSGDRLPSWMDSEIAPHFQDETGSAWWTTAFLYYKSGLPEDYVCKAPLACGEVGHLVEGFCVNPDVASYQERMAILHRTGILERLKRKERPLIVEIGGGYGALAYFIKGVVPDCTYCIIDIPSSLKFSACYLRLVTNDPVHISNGSAVKRDGSFVMIHTNSAAIETLSNIDLAINTLSFAEMPSSTVEGYARFLARGLSADGVLFEQNFNNGHLQAQTHCDPQPELAKHLHKVGGVEGEWRWGTPNLWKR